jgi:hypothetical protein
MKTNLLFLSAVLALGAPALAQTSAPKKDEAKAEASAKANDVIIFKDGKRVEGQILEETDTTIKFRFDIAGMSGETVYLKSEILSVQKGGGSVPGSTPKPETKTTTKKPNDKDVKHEEGAPTVYVVRCTGEFGRNVCASSMERVVDDIKKAQPDVLVFEIDHPFQQAGEQTPEFWMNPGAYDQLETARQISTLITDRVRDDASWTKKPRPVAYIKKALGTAAFLPFVFPEIYFAPEGLLGGVGGLEHIFDGVGDKVAQEKQYSLRLKRAEGLAEKGGHDPRIVRAMARIDYVLSYRMAGGKAEFLERMPESADEFLLTDDGDAERRDQVDDILRFKGNDVLTLNAQVAERIGFSKGTAADLRELMYNLGFTRDYVEVKGKASDIITTWGAEVDKAEANLQRLINQLRNVEVRAPGQYKERTAARTQRKSILKEMRGIFNRYKESLNPARFPADAALNQIDTLIDQIDQQQRLDGPP